MSDRLIKSIKVFVVLFWLGMLADLVLRNTSFISPSAFARAPFITAESEEWMGIYFNNRKAGYVNTIYRKEGDGQRIIEKSFLKLKVMDQVREVKTLVNSLFDLRGIMKSFDFRIDSGDINLEVEGRAQGSGIALTINTGGITREEFIKLSGPVYLPQSIKLFLKGKKIKVGDKYSIQLIDPSILKASDMNFEVLSVENLKWEGKNLKAYRVKSTFMGIESISYITEDGELLREEGPLGTVAIKESKEDAINKGWAEDDETDFILSTAIPVNEEIERPDALSYMKVRISGVNSDAINLNTHRQKFAGGVLEIKKEQIEEGNNVSPYKIPYSKDDMKDYLKSTALVQSDNADIIDLAKKIINKTSDPFNAADMLANWVYTKLEKTPTISIPSAVEVLRTKRGDCNEHAILFAALARAAGIPTKIAVGLVYQKGYFFYHAWNEVFLGEWVSIDPTFNQFPADVTHIKLAEGDLWEWLKITNVVGSIRIEILDKIEEY
jgi:hypothetical protein